MLLPLRSALWNFLRSLVTAGQRERPDDPGGAGVTASLKPVPPVLVGSDAKPLPHDEDAR